MFAVDFKRWTITPPRVRGLVDRWSPSFEGEMRPYSPYRARRPDTPAIPGDLVMVTGDSRKGVKNAVARVALYFQREFGYDFAAYWADTYHDDEKERHFLWMVSEDDDVCMVVGACGVYFRDWKDEAPTWSLGWVWLHPFARRRGMLTAAWPFLCHRFGPLHVESPLSPAMRSFLSKQPSSAVGGRPLFVAAATRPGNEGPAMDGPNPGA